MDRLLSMQVFEKVASESGFAAAARVLDMSPATVTRLVNDLEDHLGTRLIQRTTHKLVLTETGSLYLQKLKHILHEINDAEVLAQNSSEELIGTLNILSTPLLATKILAPLAGRWRAQHPHVCLDVSIDPFSYLRVEEFDLTLMSVEDTFDANIVARTIGKTERWLCASPDYLNRVGMPLEPADLQRHDYLNFPWHKAAGHNSSHTLRLSHASGHGEAVNIPMNVTFQALSFDVLLVAMRAGGGLALMPKRLVQRAILNGTLTHVLPDWNAGSLIFYAALPSRKYIPARALAMLEALAIQAQFIFPPSLNSQTINQTDVKALVL
jgi:DNA-binding transcriptional LysR family regulator